MTLKSEWRLVKASWSARWLLARLVRQELRESVAGSALGLVWLAIVPIATVGAYIFVFAVVFRTRIAGEVPYGYGAFLLSGMIPWLLTIDVMNRSAMAIIGQASLVKEVVFPIEVLPLKAVLTSMVVYSVAFGIYFAYVAFAHGGFLTTHLLFPFVLAAHLVFLAGVAFLFAAVAAFLRDLPKIIALAGMLMIYVAPVVYARDMVPTIFRPILYLNPLSYLIWCYQDVLFYGRLEHPVAWVVFPGIALVTFLFGVRSFVRLRPIFGNVL